MPAQPFDLDKEHPICPNPLVMKEHEAVKFPYEYSILDREYEKWYAQVKGRKVEQEVSQIYRVSKPGRGEYLMWNVLLRGKDWKGNDTEFSILKGRYEKPVFRLEKNPETQEVSTTQITSHQTVYTDLYTKAKLEELFEMAVDPISTVVVTPSGKRFGILSIEDFKNGAIEDLIQAATKGKSLDAIVAERNQFTYEKVESKPPSSSSSSSSSPRSLKNS